MMRKK